eukprot:Mrub_15891.p3 GENE.Mrub_15891~~Mrub_15891.p3  ORF type:complete len:116 (-),score=7.79 Mrub_15891:5-316(-)
MEHVVLFKWKDGFTDDLDKQISDKLFSMPNHIEEIIDVSYGKTFKENSNGWTHCLVVRLKSKDDLDTYRMHPYHQDLVTTLIRPNMQDIMAMDYESNRVSKTE